MSSLEKSVEKSTPVLAIVSSRTHQSVVREKVTPAKLGIQTLISQGTTFVGDIESTGGIKIDGNIAGDISIKSEGDAWVVVSDVARVDGNISARVVAVCGQVHGSIRARHVVLMASSQVDGDVYYDVIKIEEGARVSGRLYGKEREAVSKELEASDSGNEVGASCPS